MKRLLLSTVLVFLFASSAYANPFIEPLEKVNDLLEDGVVQAIAGILIAIAFFYVASGNFEKGKGYAWGVIIGISGVYAAKWIANFIWG